MTLEELNGLDKRALREVLSGCCGSQAWVREWWVYFRREILVVCWRLRVVYGMLAERRIGRKRSGIIPGSEI